MHIIKTKFNKQFTVSREKSRDNVPRTKGHVEHHMTDHVTPYVESHIDPTNCYTVEFFSVIKRIHFTLSMSKKKKG